MISSISLWSLFLFTEPAVQGFVSPNLFQKDVCGASQHYHSSPLSCLEASALAANTNSNAGDEDEDLWNALSSSKNLEESMGPEKSQMQGFISEFLKKENANNNPAEKEQEASSTDHENDNQPQQRYTHLIAIPMGSCHELSIELESVQRAILYHCPVLVHACLVPATTRLPLLYVHQEGGGASPLAIQQATESLHQIVQNVVQKCLYDKTDKAAPPEENNNIDIRNEEDNDNNGNDNSPSKDMEGANADGIRPLTLTFQSLEVDGAQNNALHTVALSDDPGTVRLQKVVAELQATIQEQLGWATSLPPDEHIENTAAADATNNDNDNDNNLQPPVFRPRVPFMRIPSNFQTYLDPLPKDRDELLRTSEEGGNGISPIFWATWWDDVFGMARLPEIGVYPRSSSSSKGLAEDAFSMPSGKVVPLPVGNAALTQQEAKFEEYQEQRMKQAEYDVKLDHQQEKDGGSSSIVDRSDDRNLDEFDPMLTKTRARLESLYQQDILEATQEDADLEKIEPPNKGPERPIIDATLLDDWTQERIRKANAANGITTYEEGEAKDNDDQKASASTNSDVDAANGKTDEELDKWTRERIRKAVDNLEAVKARERLAIKKDKIDIQDNPVFQKFKDGTLVPESEKETAIVEHEMEPFPSREQFVGFWHVMSSPTGFEPEDKDGSSSENLVLRVDGTTAGGPILDPETNQKAAGGTWKITPDEGDDTAQLRIRLVIPPKKERILVMEGTATKRALLSRNDIPPTASSTFGIPALEEKQQRARDMDEGLADLTEEKIMCTGKVWLEDAVTRKNKFDIGEFSLVKLNTPKDPSQYTITIPRPIRTQD